MNFGLQTFSHFKSLLNGLGNALIMFFRSMTYLKSVWKYRDRLISQIFSTSYGSLTVTVIVAFFSGAVLVLQVGRELKAFGVADNIGGMISVAMCREMGPVMTGIILSGLLGSRLASELGTMKVSEEIDALHIMSIRPEKFLVMPRILALLFVVPVLTVYADFIGIVGGAMVARGILGIDFPKFIQRATDFLTMADLYVGLVKAVVFGATIGIVGCYQGLQAQHGPRGVGRVTMKSVVISMLFVIMLNYIVGWMFF